MVARVTVYFVLVFLYSRIRVYMCYVRERACVQLYKCKSARMYLRTPTRDVHNTVHAHVYVYRL